MSVPRMSHRTFDWAFMIILIFALVVFVWFVSQRSISGQAIGGSVSTSHCLSYEEGLSYSVVGRVNLCANQIHRVDFFEVMGDTFLDCRGSTIQGEGGALFVAREDSPSVTLHNCVVSGYDGLYVASAPVRVTVENTPK